MIHDRAPYGSHDQFISLSDVSRMGRSLLKNKICLYLKDAILIRLWIDRIKNKNTFIFYKNQLDPASEDSELQNQAFVMCIQTGFQLKAFWQLGNSFIGIDATQNITQYENYLLFMIIARDRWGHGE